MPAAVALLLSLSQTCFSSFMQVKHGNALRRTKAEGTATLPVPGVDAAKRGGMHHACHRDGFAYRQRRTQVRPQGAAASTRAHAVEGVAGQHLLRSRRGRVLADVVVP